MTRCLLTRRDYLSKTRPAQHSFFNDTWNSHDEMISSSKIKKDIKKPFEYNVWIKKHHIMHLIKEV